MRFEMTQNYVGPDAVRLARKLIADMTHHGLQLEAVVAQGTWSLDGMDMHPAKARVTVSSQGVRHVDNPKHLLRPIGASILEVWLIAEGYPQGFRADPTMAIPPEQGCAERELSPTELALASIPHPGEQP